MGEKTRKTALSRKNLDIFPRHGVYWAISDPTRRAMLRLLAGKEMPIKDIYVYFPISRAAVTKHLHVLADAGLVIERRDGRKAQFILQPEPLLELKQWLSFFEGFWDQTDQILQ